ncbi:Asp-tRNA(Asn) amidotransferase subunit GatC [Stygiolobus azoricus]|uniref:Aspartyl/glutamyl-tRNA(Asn/Gln) amidotransferase subunit C n=1 Tax=Stygiolobus azoricus TaxID=41675 RepID=A0A650CNI8_9CREN|nr:Asp-tRNA(Asn) amidotransferase subunit GatC [Stygiolobus azoricus]QGR19255.1 Asp-tRNA(Asn) amidotransferase subunit GatC [Stygiolobus azoricus]
MEIDDKLLEKLQALALVEIKGQEKEKIKRDLQNILQFFDKINQLDLTNIEPLFHPLSSGKLRKDEPMKPLTREEALQNVKRKEDGYIVGPRTYGD